MRKRNRLKKGSKNRCHCKTWKTGGLRWTDKELALLKEFEKEKKGYV